MSEQEFPPGFEWDAGKAEANLRKHGVAFADVVGMFDHRHLDDEDLDHSTEEQRSFVIGETGGNFYAVVYTWRGENRRLISARRAVRREIAQFMSTFY